MKSKSLILKQSPTEWANQNKTLDFVNLYKSAAESNIRLTEKRKSDEGTNKENSFIKKNKSETPKRDYSPTKNKKKNKNETIELSHIHIDGNNLDTNLHKNSPVTTSKFTSTPNTADKILKKLPTVKSIMKNTSLTNEIVMGESNVEVSGSKRKKRNKSVSFMLDDTEDIVIKRTKSDDTISVNKNQDIPKKTMKTKYRKDDMKNKKDRKLKKNRQAQIQSIAHSSKNLCMETDNVDKTEDMVSDDSKIKPDISGDTTMNPSTSNTQGLHINKKKFKKVKKQKKSDGNTKSTESETTNNCDSTSTTTDVTKEKKLKKKKHKVKPEVDSTETEGEPQTKSHKKDIKPELIAEDLENLSIGDNAHTLTNLLDEMTVVDKNKRKKNRQRSKKGKKQTASTSSSEVADLEKIEEGKEKIKWKKRKWNKDKKVEMDEDCLLTSVIIENLPLTIMVNYKKLLTDHFNKYGPIRKIGVAEVYPTGNSKPEFTTSIHFFNEESAEMALQEDNTTFEGATIYVKRPLPATQTTIVVRSYAELSEPILSSVFGSAGRIRNIRHVVKGKNSTAVSFIEFDGPEAVARAIKMAEDIKIGGKNIHVSKFEQRHYSKNKNKKPKAKVKPDADSENEGDSEDSNE